MKFCKYCGSQIEDGIQICPACGKDLSVVQNKGPKSSENSGEEKALPVKIAVLGRKKLVIGIIATVLLIGIIFLVIQSGNCDYGSCNNKAAPGYDYCYSHKCAITDCNRSSGIFSNYCYSHALIYDEEANTVYVPSYQLRISNVSVYSSSSYTYAEGTLTNNSDTTVKYVQIKGAFKNSSGTVVDTDWTYAVGSEGLAPGESCKWKLSVDKDYNIKDCDITILDYDY